MKKPFKLFVFVFVCCHDDVAAFFQSNWAVLGGRPGAGSTSLSHPRILPQIQHHKHEPLLRRMKIHALLSTKKTSIEISILTAQALLNEKKHNQLKDDLARRFPLVPRGFFDPAIDLVANAFRTIAPDTLEEALKPGGMEKIRPGLKTSIVRSIRNQKAISEIPVLSQDEKIKLLEFAIDLALDQLLKDSEWILSSPEVRLKALEEEIRIIKNTEMDLRQRVLYRFKRRPFLHCVFVAATLLYCYSFAQAGSWKAAFATLSTEFKLFWIKTQESFGMMITKK